MVNSERRGRRLQRKFEEEDEYSKKEGIKTLLSSKQGRRFLWLWLAELRVFQTPYAANALETARQCGEHNAGLKLLALLTEADMDAYLVLLKENQNVERNRLEQSAVVRDSDRNLDGDTDD